MIPAVVALPLLVVSFVIAFFVGKSFRGAAVPPSETEKQRLIEAAQAEAESVKRQAVLEAKELAQKARAETDAELKTRQGDIDRRGTELGTRERELDRQERALKQRIEESERGEKQLAGREAAAEAAARAAAGQAAAAKGRLEQIAGLTAAEAKAQLADEVRAEARRAAADEIKKIEDAARAEADDAREGRGDGDPAVRERVRRRAHRRDRAAAVRRPQGPDDRSRGPQRARARGGDRRRPDHRRHGRVDHDLLLQPGAARDRAARDLARSSPTAASTRRASRRSSRRREGGREAVRKEAGEQAVFDLGLAPRAPRARAPGRQAQVPAVVRAERAAALDRGRLPRGR